MDSLVKIGNCKTDPTYGINPENRTLGDLFKKGIINLDKSSGINSSQAAEQIKNILNIKKISYSGTLDPKVTGVLPILIGKSINIASAFAHAKKEYVCVMKLHKKVDDKKLESVFAYFNGKKIYQKPPMKSAVKKRLRIREVYDLKLMEIEDRTVLFRVLCESGTYIRKLCGDIGLILGCGASMHDLRRTSVGELNEKTALANMVNIKDAYEEGCIKNLILPIEKGVEHLKKIWVHDCAVDALCCGAELYVPGVVKLSPDIGNKDLIALMTLKGELISLGRSNMNSLEIIRKKRGIVARQKRVIMEEGTYPKSWRKKRREVRGGRGRERDLKLQIP